MYTDYTKFFKPEKSKDLPLILDMLSRRHHQTEVIDHIDYTKYSKGRT